MKAAYLEGVLTSNDPLPIKLPPGSSIPAEICWDLLCSNFVACAGDSDQFVHERLLNAVGDDPGDMQRKGEQGAIVDDTQRRFKMEMSPFWEPYSH